MSVIQYAVFVSLKRFNKNLSVSHYRDAVVVSLMSGTEMAISKSNQSSAAATPSESMSSIASPLDLQDIAVGLGEVLAKEVSLQQNL